MTTRLPDGDALFRTFFYPWYGEEGMARHPDGLKADLDEFELPEGADQEALQTLSAEEQTRTGEQLDKMQGAAVTDLAGLTGCRPPANEEWVAALDTLLDREEVNRIVRISKPDNYANNYLILCCEAGALVARILQDQHPGLVWIYDQPYWESALFDPDTSTRINVFHWVMKKMSETGVEEPLLDKVRATGERLKGDG